MRLQKLLFHFQFKSLENQHFLNTKIYITLKFRNLAFYDTNIESLYIPSNLELENGWCSVIYNINKVTIMPDNKKCILYDDKFILEKSNPENEFFDALVFTVRNIEVAKIPDLV